MNRDVKFDQAPSSPLLSVFDVSLGSADLHLILGCLRLTSLHGKHLHLLLESKFFRSRVLGSCLLSLLLLQPPHAGIPVWRQSLGR